MYLGLMFLIKQQFLTNPWLLRYLQGHSISLVTLAMFFVGIASLLVIAKNVLDQFNAARWITIREVESEDAATESASLAGSQDDEPERPIALSDQVDVCLAQLDRQRPVWKLHYLWNRLSRTVQAIRHSGTTNNAEEELKYLSESDAVDQQQRYSLVRILIWATPMLGFLGTVLGISEALGGLNIGPDNDFQQMMDGLRGSLYVAFDTTALALTLSMVLMFLLFLVDRFESQLLQLVDQRAREEITAVFDLTEDVSDWKRVTDAIVLANMKGVQQQLDVWRQTIANAEAAWSASLTQVNSLVQSNLSEALEENVGNLSHYLGEAIGKADEAMQYRLQQWQVTLSANARSMQDQQQSLLDQADQLEQLMKRQNGAFQLTDAVQQQQEAVASTHQLKQALEDLHQSIDQHRQSTSDMLQRIELAQPKDKSTGSEPGVVQQGDSESESSPGVVRVDAPSSHSPLVGKGVLQSLLKTPAFQDVSAQSSGVDSESVAEEVILPFPTAAVSTSASDGAATDKSESRPAQSEVILKFPAVDAISSVHEAEQAMQNALAQSSVYLTRRKAA